MNYLLVTLNYFICRSNKLTKYLFLAHIQRQELWLNNNKNINTQRNKNVDPFIIFKKKNFSLWKDKMDVKGIYILNNNQRKNSCCYANPPLNLLVLNELIINWFYVSWGFVVAVDPCSVRISFQMVKGVESVSIIRKYQLPNHVNRLCELNECRSKLCVMFRSHNLSLVSRIQGIRLT